MKNRKYDPRWIAVWGLLAVIGILSIIIGFVGR